MGNIQSMKNSHENPFNEKVCPKSGDVHQAYEELQGYKLLESVFTNV